MAANWGERTTDALPTVGAKEKLETRHRQVGDAFVGERVVIPAGDLKSRNSDADHRFRSESSFAYLTGLGGEMEPGAVLVLEPTTPKEEGGATHEAILYFTPRASRTSEEFYADARHGEFWVGARPSLEEMSESTGLRARDLANLKDDLAAGEVTTTVLRGIDPQIDALVDEVAPSRDEGHDVALEKRLSHVRMFKDDYELEQIREATAATKEGFERVIKALPGAIGRPRSERALEAAFGSAAREMGNGVSFETIVASGNHANTLHWTENTGTVQDGDLVLVDAGVELDSLYSADITRTFPANGKFTPAQARVYEAVLDAVEAGLAAAGKPGAVFGDVHDSAQKVLASHLEDWGMLPVPVEESLTMEGQQHRRWMPHGTSHHLGLDVHDCSAAENYMEAPLAPGMVFTIEPGLYFREDDLAVPEELRGIGVRIEDNIVIDEDGKPVRVSQAIPRTLEDVEEWMAELNG